MFRLCVTIQNRKLSLTMLTVCLILVFLLTVTVFPLASAKAFGLITIVGTVTIGVAALASILMITFGASGMDGALRNQAAATGTEPLTYMGQLINRFAASGGGVLPQTFAAKVAAGLSYLSNGDLYLDADATAAVADFQRWAWSASGGDLVDYAPLGEGNYWHYNGINIELVELTESRVFGSTTYYLSKWLCKATPLPIYYFLASTNGGARYWTCAIHNAVIFAPYNEYAARYVSRTYDTGNSYSLGSSYTLREGEWEQFMGGSLTGINVVENASINTTLDMPSPEEFSLEPVVIGDPDTFYGPSQQDQGSQLPLANTVSVSAEAASQLHLDNYLRAVAAAYAGTGTASVPVTDVGTGDEQTLPLSVPLDTPIGVVGVTDASIDQAGSVAASDAVASDFAGTDEFTMDLTRFFPFCIPFDLYAILTKFETTAEAPVVNWSFDFGALGTYALTLDFGPYDSLASLLRDLETVAFAVGLMLVTKRLIQGGD